MTIIRGSTHLLQGIKEVTFGTTPATPALAEFPISNVQKTSTQTVMHSSQIRSHPFVDRMMYGRFVHALQIDFELQGPNHDALIETAFGGAITSKSLAYADLLKSMTLESAAQGAAGSLFDQFTGVYFDKLSISASASDTEGVKCSLTGTAKAGTLDAATSLAATNAAETPVDPFVFADATLTVAGSSTAIVTGNFDLTRKVDPLMLWGSRLPREFMAGDVTITGKITVPYDGSVQSAIVTAFSDNALVWTFNNVGATVFRKFTMPKCKIIDIGRQINTRSGIMQTLDFEAYYDTGTSTGVTMATQ